MTYEKQQAFTRHECRDIHGCSNHQGPHCISPSIDLRYSSLVLFDCGPFPKCILKGQARFEHARLKADLILMARLFYRVVEVCV